MCGESPISCGFVALQCFPSDSACGVSGRTRRHVVVNGAGSLGVGSAFLPPSIHLGSAQLHSLSASGGGCFLFLLHLSITMQRRGGSPDVERLNSHCRVRLVSLGWDGSCASFQVVSIQVNRERGMVGVWVGEWHAFPEAASCGLLREQNVSKVSCVPPF